MSLFRRAQPVADNPPITEGETTPTPQINIDYDIIVNRVTDNLRPLFRQAQPQTQPQPEPEPEPEDEMTPEERVRTERIVDRRVQTLMNPYQNTFDRTMPGVAKREALDTLTEGEKIIVGRHIKEVEGYVTEATTNNPAARGIPELWRRSMKLAISEHIDEVEALAHKNIGVEDLPPQFAPPTTGQTKTRPEDQLTPFESHALDYYQSRYKNNDWDANSFKYYQSIKSGTLEDMVKQHKERQKKD